MLDSIRVMHDRVLLLLPENPAEQQTRSGLFLAHGLTPVITYGRVLKAGPDCRDVQPGDIVAFPPTVGDQLPLTEAHEGLFIRESDIVAIVPKRDVAAASEVA